jgi:hypothetical protein
MNDTSHRLTCGVSRPEVEYSTKDLEPGILAAPETAARGVEASA